MENKQKSVVNNFLLGFALGVLVPVLTVIFINAEANKHLGMFEFFKRLHENNQLSALVSLCAIPNLGIFFLFIWKSNYKTVRGVMAATIILVVLVFSLKFLV
ncbi:MAG: hypothetical protein JXR60_00545 [Bacteroidales bacterium]|nr:hypothetical protein [Bacteroidales bacterium]